MGKIIFDRLNKLGLQLPNPTKPVANYVPYVFTRNQIYISGQLAFNNGNLMHPGTLGEDVSVEQGQEAIEYCTLNLLAQLNSACKGDLHSVKNIIKINGFIKSAPHFIEQSTIMDSASNLLTNIFLDRGKHSRTAIGVASLPLGASVEIDGIFEI